MKFRKKLLNNITLLYICSSLPLSVSAADKIDTWIFDKGEGGMWSSEFRAVQREYTNSINRDDATAKELPLNDSCVREVSGSIYNSCSYPISVAYCFANLPIEKWDGQCKVGQVQTGFIQSGASILPHAWSDPVDVHWMACKLPKVPVDVKYDPSSNRPSGACGLLKNPTVLFSSEVLNRFSQ